MIDKNIIQQLNKKKSIQDLQTGEYFCYMNAHFVREEASKFPKEDTKKW